MDTKQIVLLVLFIVYVAYRIYKRIKLKEVLRNYEPSTSQLLDVRSLNEYNHHSISGTINIPVDVLVKGDIEKLDKSKTIYVFCASGMRSNIATRYLTNHGFDVINISTIKNCPKIVSS